MERKLNPDSRIDALAERLPELLATTPPSVLSLVSHPDDDDAATTPARRELPRRRHSWHRWAGLIAAVLTLAFGALYYMEHDDPAAVHLAGEYVSGPSETTTATLADGTVVRLAPNSRLRIHDVPNGREVSLDGRAYFAVTHNPEQPFRVRTAKGDAIALGTRFEVRVGRDLRVVVVEGEVAVGTEQEKVHVAAGEMSMVANGVVTQPVKVEVRPMVAWVGRFIAFQSTPLHQAMNELEAEYGTRITITDSKLANETITGSFTDRSLEEIVTIVCGVLGAQCSVQDDTVTIGR